MTLRIFFDVFIQAMMQYLITCGIVMLCVTPLFVLVLYVARRRGYTVK